jgi:hypothetical protein
VARYRAVHQRDVMDPKFYENDFISTRIKEIEFVRSPFYELSRAHKMGPEEASELLDEMALKQAMVDDTLERVTKSFAPSRESVAFTRYADRSIAKGDEKDIFQ